MSGSEEVARIEAVIGANLQPLERELTKGEARTRKFAATTKTSMEAAETAVEQSAAAMGRAAAAGAASQSASGAKVAAGMRVQAASATAMGAQMAQAYGKAASSVAAASSMMVSANARSAAAATSQASAARVAGASVVKSQQVTAAAAEQSAARVQAASARSSTAMQGAATRGVAFARSMGSALGLVGGYGAAAFTASILKTGATFDQTMSGVRAATGATQAEFDALRGTAIALGADTAFSATEVGASMVELGKAGYNAERSLKAIPGVLDAAAASGEDMASVTTIVVETINALGMAAEQSTEVADALAWSANATTSSIGDMGEAMKFVAPVGAKMGAGLHTINAALAILAENGIKGSMAGTSLAGTMQSMMAPNARVEKMLKANGIAFRDAAGNVKPLAENLDMLREKTAAMGKADGDKFLARTFGRENLKAILSLLSAGSDGLRKYEAASRSAKGEAAAFASVLRDNLAGDLEELQGGFESAAIKVSDLFRDDLRGGVARFKVYVDSDDFARDAKMVVGTVLNIGEAMGETAAFVYRHADAIKVAAVAYVGLKVAAQGAATAQALAGITSMGGAGRRGGGGAGMAAVSGAALMSGRGGAAAKGVASMGDEAAVAASKLTKFAGAAKSVAKAIPGIGALLIGAELMRQFADASSDTGDDVASTTTRVDELVAATEKVRSKKERIELEIVEKRQGERAGGDGRTGSGKARDARASESSAAAVARQQETNARELAKLEKQLGEAQERRTRRKQDALLLDREASKLQEEIARRDASGETGLAASQTGQKRNRRDASLDGADKARADAKALNAEIAALEASFAKLSRAQSGITFATSGAAAEQFIKSMSDAERKAAGLPKNINAAMEQIGYVNIDGQWLDSLRQGGIIAARRAAAAKAAANKQLVAIGAGPVSSAWLSSFEGQMARARANAAQGVHVNITTSTKNVFPSGRGPLGALGRASGGAIEGPGTGTSDDVPVWASNGEWVIRERAASKYGDAAMESVNRGTALIIPEGYARGGKVVAKKSAALTQATRQAAIEADAARSLKQATQQYNAALAAQKGKSGQKLKDARALVAERARAVVDARARLKDVNAQKASDARAAAIDRIDAGFVGADAANRQSSIAARGTEGLDDDIASVTSQKATADSRVAALQRAVGGTKNPEAKAQLQEKLNAAIEEQLGLDNERNVLIKEQNDRVRQAEIDKPRSAMLMTDAVRDLQMAQAEATAGLEDDAAVRQSMLADEERRRSLLQEVLNRGDLSEEERAAKLGEMAASQRTTNGLLSDIRAATQQSLESQLAQAQRERDVAQETARLSEAALSTFSGTADIGMGRGSNAIRSGAGLNDMPAPQIHFHSTVPATVDQMRTVADLANAGGAFNGYAAASYAPVQQIGA